MIDNMVAHNTFIHTVSSTTGPSSFKLFPTQTNGTVFIEASQTEKLKHQLERVEVIDGFARVVRRYVMNQEKYALDIRDLPAGTYHIRVFSDKKSKTFTVFLNGG